MLQRDILIVGALFLSVGTLLCSSLSQASEPEIAPGNKIVVLHDTHVQVGTDKLEAVEAGVEITAEAVQDDWIAVTVERDSKSVSGWIHSGHAIPNPEIAFAALAVRVAWAVDWLTTEDFERMDSDADGQVIISEFLRDTNKQTLDDLNEQLHRELAACDKAINENLRRQRARFGKVLDADWRLRRHLWLTLQIVQRTGSPSDVNVTFKNWKRKPFRHEAEQIAEDFLKTRDIRRSRVAQQLIDREEPKARAQRAQALFKWADKNDDGKLSLDEFKLALGKPK